jgi:hypothetical protein
MTRGIGRGVPFLTLCFSVFLSGAASAAPPSPAATPAAPLPAATLMATVQSIDAQARTLEVVTGVGYALRVLKLSWKETPTPTVKAAAAGTGMSQLKPGDLVRVEYVKAPEGNVVKTIELPPSPAPQSVR